MTLGEKQAVVDELKDEAIRSIEFLSVVEHLDEMGLDLTNEEFEALAREIHDEVTK